MDSFIDTHVRGRWRIELHELRFTVGYACVSFLALIRS